MLLFIFYPTGWAIPQPPCFSASTQPLNCWRQRAVLQPSQVSEQGVVVSIRMLFIYYRDYREYLSIIEYLVESSMLSLSLESKPYLMFWTVSKFAAKPSNYVQCFKKQCIIQQVDLDGSSSSEVQREPQTSGLHVLQQQITTVPDTVVPLLTL